MSTYKNILYEICKNNDINIKSISDDWVYILERNTKIHYILGYKFDINDSAISQILDDKYAFYELCKYKNYPIIEYNIVFKDYKKEYINELFNKYKDVVLKPNNGTCGNNVYHITNIDELYKYIDKLLKTNYSLCITPYINIKYEYRLIMLNGSVLYLYKKIRPIVYGDGIHTIKELLLEFNYPYFSKESDLPTDILAKGKKYTYGWKHNLSCGSIIDTMIDDETTTKLKSIATNLVNDINIKFCSIDIIEDYNNNFYIMEGNSGVMMDYLIKLLPNGYSIAKDIYEQAILSMFKENK